MRPSWPLPRMPMVAPGRIGSAAAHARATLAVMAGAGGPRRWDGCLRAAGRGLRRVRLPPRRAPVPSRSATGGRRSQRARGSASMAAARVRASAPLPLPGRGRPPCAGRGEYAAALPCRAGRTPRPLPSPGRRAAGRRPAAANRRRRSLQRRWGAGAGGPLSRPAVWDAGRAATIRRPSAATLRSPPPPTAGRGTPPVRRAAAGGAAPRWRPRAGRR